jgi:hypothetical protein
LIYQGFYGIPETVFSRDGGLFRLSIKQLTEWTRSYLYKGGMGMPKYRKKIWSGDVYEVEEFYCPRTIGKKYERGRSENLTSEEQAKRNLQIARKKITRSINTNFNGDDYFVLLTYAAEVTVEQAKKEFSNFRDRLNRYRNKNGFSKLKYIAVVETQGKKNRVHHHVVMNRFEGLSMKEAAEILEDVWGKGTVLIKKLYKNQKDNRLASYISKENIEKGAKRWSTSRNLKKPEVKLEVIKETKRKVSLRPPKGFDVIVQTEDYFAEIGWVRYMKAVRRGGMDYGEYEGGAETDAGSENRQS